MSDLTTGYTRPPADSVGGVDEFYVMQRKYVDFDNATVADGEVTALAMQNGYQAYRYEIEENLANYQDVLTQTIGNGSRMADQTLSVTFNDMLKATSNELMNLITEPCVVICKTSQGDFKVLGWDYGLRFETAAGDTGTAKADRNGFILTGKGQQKQLAYDISSAIVDSLLLVAS